MNEYELSVIVLVGFIALLFVQVLHSVFKTLKNQNQGGKRLKFGKEKKLKKGAVILCDYQMIFDLKDGSKQEVAFRSKNFSLDRNTAIKEHFITEGSQVLTLDRSETINLVNVKAFRLEKQESVDLLNVPETLSENILDLPEMAEEVRTDKKVIPSSSTKHESRPFSADETRAMRIELEMTQKVFGEKTGIDPRRVSKIERGVVVPTLEEINAIHTVFSGLYMQEEPTTHEVVEPLGETEEILEELSMDELEDDFEEPEPKEENKKLKFFATRKKPEKDAKDEKLPTGKKTISKYYRWAVWAGIFVLGASGITAFMISSGASATVGKMQAGVSAIEDTINKPVEEKKDESGRIQTYFSEFLPLYMNISMDNEAKTLREDTLTQYFAEKLDTTDGELTRTLLDYRFFDLIEKDGFGVIQYVVHYSVEDAKQAEPAEKKESDKETEKEEIQTEFTQLINIPYATVKGQYGIIDYPYFSVAPELNIPLEMQQGDTTKQEMSSDKIAEVTEFTDQFYKNYADNSVEDMQYMMNDPESLNGEFEFVASENKFYEENEVITVESVVEFKLKGSSITHKENMNLQLIKKDGKYFVKTLNHTVGGN